MPKGGGDRFDQLPKDDPNYDIARRFHLEGWADSHGVVADTLAGQVSFSDWVESCIKTFQLAATTQVAFKDEIPPSQKCQAVDRMAKLFIRRFEASVRSHSKGLGKANAKAAIDRLSRRVHEIAARSKQQIFQHALAKEIAEPIVTRVQSEKRKPQKPVRQNQRYVAIDYALRAIAESRPQTQEEIFQSLEGRHIAIPLAEPFLPARGWMAGFRKAPVAARAWLSKRWRELDLPPLPRGPKGLKKTE